MARGRRALLLALGLDNAGSGLFLSLVVVYLTHVLTHVVGVPLARAGALLTAGTLLGLVAPPLAGRCVDRAGPRAVVTGSQLLQAAGVGLYLVALGPVGVVAAAGVVAAGTHTLSSALFALIADVSPPGPRDHAFAVVDMVRSASFGVGAQVCALLLAVVGRGALVEVLALDGLTVVLAAVALALFVHPTGQRSAPQQAAPATGRRPDRGCGGTGPTWP